MTHEELIALYPDGRTFYDETDDTETFVETCHKMGLTTATHRPPPDNADGLTPWTTVYVPARLLFDFYALNLRVGT